ALTLLQAEAATSSNSPAVRRLIAVTAARAGKLDVAIAEFERLLSTGSEDPRLFTGLGEVYRQKGDVLQAIELFEKAKELAPTDPAPAMLLASALENEGRLEEAEANYRHALSLAPDNPLVLNNLAFVLVNTGGDLDEALRFAQRALHKMPGHPNLSDTLGWIYLKKGMNDSALQIFRNLVQQHPDSPTFHYHLGAALLTIGDSAGARTELQNALANRPSPTEETQIRELLRQSGS
ncbi:MAG: tetratricopeptide repeat protein, partial [bacterium]|nr:tetratricopeptide repeat protein [bacterium]